MGYKMAVELVWALEEGYLILSILVGAVVCLHVARTCAGNPFHNQKLINTPIHCLTT